MCCFVVVIHVEQGIVALPLLFLNELLLALFVNEILQYLVHSLRMGKTVFRFDLLDQILQPTLLQLRLNLIFELLLSLLPLALLLF